MEGAEADGDEGAGGGGDGGGGRVGDVGSGGAVDGGVGGGGGGGGVDQDEDDEEDEDDGSRGCVGPRAWVVLVASLPFLAIGISLSCIGYLAPDSKEGESDVGGLERHFRVVGPIFLSACGAVFLVCIACRRPGVGRVGTEVGGRGGGPGGAAERGEWWREEGKGGPQPPSGRHHAARDDAALWGSCTLGDCQCPPTPGAKGGGASYPHVSRMVPPLLKVIPPTPESPAARKEGGRRPPSPRHHLLILTPLRLKQRT